MSRPSVGRVIPVSQVLRYWGNLKKMGPNTLNHVQGYGKSNRRSSTPHYTSNDFTLVSRPSRSRVIHVSQVFRDWGFEESKPKYPKSCESTHEK